MVVVWLCLFVKLKLFVSCDYMLCVVGLLYLCVVYVFDVDFGILLLVCNVCIVWLIVLIFKLMMVVVVCDVVCLLNGVLCVIVCDCDMIKFIGLWL